MKQTSIEWLKERLKYRFLNNDTEESIFEQAKEMHKQEIKDAFTQGAEDGFYGDGSSNKEQYYQETFKKDEL